MIGSRLQVAVRGVSHFYGKLEVLQGIDLVAEPGRVLALVGPSGCGKSTLLGIIGGLICPSAGEVTVEGHVADGCLNVMTPGSRISRSCPGVRWRRMSRSCWSG